MIRKNTIVFSTVFLFACLNFMPFFLIDCTETNGSSHLENVFNKCCSSSIMHMKHMSVHSKGEAFRESCCLCFESIAGGDYIIPNVDKHVVGLSTFIFPGIVQNTLEKDRNLIAFISESPPISTYLIETEVLLI
jgi:hypothetical protein